MEFSASDVKMLFDDIENLSKDDLLGIPFVIGNTSLKNDCFVVDNSNEMYVTLKSNLFDSDSYIQLRTYVNQCLNRANTQDKCLICNNNWCSDEIIKCANNSCANAVHESCYGLIPRNNQKRWYCWNCINQTTLTCAVCLEKGGILKPTNNGQYCHVICAAFTPETSLADNPMLEPVLGIKNISKERYTLQCSLCNRHKGACIQCCYGKCTVSFHPLCALKSQLLLISDNGIPFVTYCNKHMKLIQKSKIKYCICNKESIENDFYIECTYGKGGCNGWVHPECIGMTKEEAEQLENYICPLCKPLYEKEENEKQKTKTKSKETNENNKISSLSSSKRNLRKRNRVSYNYEEEDEDDENELNSSSDEDDNNPFPLSSEFCDNSWDIIGKDDLTIHLRLTNELIGLNYVNENYKGKEKEYEEEEEEIESEVENERGRKDKGEDGDDDYNSSESNDDESDTDKVRRSNRKRRSYSEGSEEEEEDESEEESVEDQTEDKDKDDVEEEDEKEVKEEKSVKKNKNKNKNKNKSKEVDENENDEYESLFYYTSTWKIIKQNGLNIRLKLTGSVLDKNNRNNDNNRERKRKSVMDNDDMEIMEDDNEEDVDNSENNDEETPKEKKTVIKKKTPIKRKSVSRRSSIKKKRNDYLGDDDNWSDSYSD